MKERELERWRREKRIRKIKEIKLGRCKNENWEYKETKRDLKNEGKSYEDKEETRTKINFCELKKEKQRLALKDWQEKKLSLANWREQTSLLEN